ncbi:TonB-dependent receptor domain-containing protein [Dyadobacter subterraneus]|uniref:TonB-dependent receptor n=1 Tax=Dyadobacter subterraneus TaxID=2773304 RepID=A0ABR9WF58_9BACT|nr:TonB-dependent receptor [Dyadobacter subterraneus]MBE9464028.1 TonB-dependent receptor [Dyadobacter subterraneus]
MTKIYYALFFILLSLSTFAQKMKVTGRVTDEKGEALIGASVVEKGTSNGTSTDGNGIYTLAVGYSNATLIVTYVGYNKIEKEINGQETQNFTLTDATVLSQVTVVGSRNLNRSSTDTPAPIDVINIQEVTTKQGQLDVNQLLQFAAPSFNSNRQTGSDGADHVDPASLRGLGPDQTLVLINGKRRHQSALVNLFGSRGRGNTGTDLNAIPAAAIERIEILRDGAAAQYGSDAIAGVINIVLKETVNQLTANVNAGMYSAKYRYDNKKFDGQNYNVNLNYGVKIAKTGFLNVTADYNFRDHTNRANTSPIDEISRRQYGDPQMKNTAIYYNAKIPLGKNIQVYSFGGHNTRNGDAYAWTRFADDVKNIPAIYPNGFDPIIASKITDNAATIGIRGVWKQWDIDLSNTYGFNRFHFSVKNSLNTSLGLQSPTSFDAGGFQLGQNVTNLNFTRNYKSVLSGLNVAFGGEYRMERYKIFAGEEASYKTYDQNFAGGSQGFPGFSPVDVTNHGRSNVAAYLDVEADITKKLLVDAAARFENYSDFGSTLNGKLGARYKLTDDIAIRGSVSTGFRAPSLAQKYFNSTFTNFVNGQAVQVLLANNNSAVTKALGIPQLKQETSENASLGITVTPKASSLSITVDGYYVKVKNRVVLTGQFSDEDEAIGPLLKSLNVGQAQFFTNALSYTTTKGIDVIIAHSTPLGQGRFSTTLASNFNWMKLGPINTSPKLAGKENTYFNQRERSFVLASAPPSKINLTFDYTISKLSFMLRFVRFGEIKLTNWNYGSINPDTNQEYTQPEYTDVYKPKVQTDITVNYKFSKQFSLSVGGSNILNVYPNMSKPYLTESGGAWDPVQMGSNGAFLFTRLGLRF